MHVGLNSNNLLFVYWEHYWEMDIDEMRKKLNVPTPPKRVFKPKKKNINKSAMLPPVPST